MSKSKSMCSGCYNDFYNQNCEGGCRNFGGAKVVKRVKVGTFEPPPYAKSRARDFLSCYTCIGYSFLSLSDNRVVKDVQKTRERWDRENAARAERERQASEASA